MEVLGELRFDGRPAGTIHSAWMGKEAWRAPDGTGLIGVRGGRSGKAASCDVQADAGFVVVADCTLYGQDGLVSALGLGHWSGSSAELLARAYLRWGRDMLARLDGDFAFVVCDWRNRKVFAATDPMGMRPLFYRYITGKCFSFSTSPESLAAWCGLDPRIPESRLLEPLLGMEELAHLRPDVPGISRLLAAHTCEAEGVGLRLRKYWTPSDNRPDLGEHDIAGWIEGLRVRIGEAVRKRLVDGVRLGVTVSGGLDSSSMLALACRALPAGHITAYSALDRTNPSCPETRAIDQVLAASGVAWVQADVGNPETYAAMALDALAATPRFILGRQGFLPLFDTLAAKSGANVMMNGMDADALLNGQDLHERWVSQGKWRLALRDARRSDRVLGVTSGLPRVYRSMVKAVIPSPALDVLRMGYGRFAQRLRPDILRMDERLRAHLAEQKREQRRLLRRPARAHELPASSMDALIVMDSVGRYQTRSRGAGIEMRCPFLDRELIEFAAWIPLELRQRHGRHKWILRKAMNPYLPHAVTWRGDKYHLACKFSRSVLGPVLDQIIRDFNGSGPAIAPYVDRELFLREVPGWHAGSLDAIWKLNSLLLLENWLQHNHDKVAFGH